MKRKLFFLILITLGNLEAVFSQVLSNNENHDTIYFQEKLEEKKAFEIDLFTQPDELWRNFDFIPGKKILFFDSFENETLDQKPSKWEVVNGNATVKNVVNKKAIFFETAQNTSIKPVFTSQKTLPKSFTLEFDLYFDIYANQSITEYGLYFNDDLNNRIEISSFSPLKIQFNGQNLPSIIKSFAYASINNFTGWHHVSLSYNFNNIKFYFDDKLIADEYAKNFNAENVSIYAKTYDYRADSDRKTFIKNFKIATGKTSIYSEIANNSKYTTNSIIFEVGKPFFMSPSSGELYKLYDFINENPNWNFIITAPNDNTIDEKYNLDISTKRAQSIKDALVKLGITERRLLVKGYKEANNSEYETSIEQKIENQRVEFIIRP